MARIKSPLNVGDIVTFKKDGSGYSIKEHVKILAVGFDRTDNRRGASAWRVKISLGDKRLWWSAAWFKRVK